MRESEFTEPLEPSSNFETVEPVNWVDQSRIFGFHFPIIPPSFDYYQCPLVINVAAKRDVFASVWEFYDCYQNIAGGEESDPLTYNDFDLNKFSQGIMYMKMLIKIYETWSISKNKIREDFCMKNLLKDLRLHQQKSGIIKATLKFPTDQFHRVIYLYFHIKCQDILIFDPTQCHVYDIRDNYIYNIDTILKYGVKVDIYAVQFDKIFQVTDREAFIEEYIRKKVYKELWDPDYIRISYCFLSTVKSKMESHFLTCWNKLRVDNTDAIKEIVMNGKLLG